MGCKYTVPLTCGVVACTLFELYNGRILFPGKTYNEMLKLMMELKAKVPHRLAEECLKTNIFLYSEIDKVTEKVRESNVLRACYFTHNCSTTKVLYRIPISLLVHPKIKSQQ